MVIENDGGKMRCRVKNIAALLMAVVLAGACSATPSMPTHFTTLQAYFAASDRGIAGFYPRSDPDKIMQCYGEAMTRQIPAGIQPDLLAVVNKRAAGEMLTPAEGNLAQNWLEDRPRFDGTMLRVNGPQARAAHYEMAMICAPEMLKK